MSDMPREIWAVPNEEGKADVWLTFDPKRENTRYIQADLAENLAKALEGILATDKNGAYVLNEDDYKIARQALAEWRENELD